MGDAAHTMTPVLGQGLNCGLEDVGVFARVLKQHQGNVDRALPAYNSMRWPDVQAVLNVNEIVANRDYPMETQVWMARSALSNCCCIIVEWNYWHHPSPCRIGRQPMVN